MSWIDTVTSLLANPTTAAAGTSMLNAMGSKTTTNSLIMNQLSLLEQNPSSAVHHRECYRRNLRRAAGHHAAGQ